MIEFSNEVYVKDNFVIENPVKIYPGTKFLINEDSHIIKTFDKSYGIESDTDFYKVPKMRNVEMEVSGRVKILDSSIT